MNFDLLSSLARTRQETLLREAAIRRALRTAERRKLPLRHLVARVVRAFGYAALTLGDALVEQR